MAMQTQGQQTKRKDLTEVLFFRVGTSGDFPHRFLVSGQTPLGSEV